MSISLTLPSWLLAGAMALSSLSFVSNPARAEEPLANTVTEEDVIAGTMNIDFRTRTNLDSSGDLKSGSPALGATDIYKFQLNVAKTTEYQGQIERQPKLFSSVLGRTKQNANLTYNSKILVLNPKDLKQKKAVGAWVGTVPVDPNTGAYDLAGGKAQESPLRIAVDTAGTAQGFTDSFAGKMFGKAEKKESLAAYTYKRVVAGKQVSVTVKKSDPMRFERVELAKGPAAVYPRTTVDGRLDYDYETGNWYTDGIKFKYAVDGKDYEDLVTGTIKWVEDADRATNGKGYYEFNLRFNEEKNKTPTSEGAAFEKMSDEDAFFAVDNSIPCLTGKVEYVDTFIPGGTTPSASKVTYHLGANKLTKQQIVNFFKLWMVCVGPTNDE